MGKPCMMLQSRKGNIMEENEKKSKSQPDYDFLKWFSEFDKSLTPNQRAAYIKMISAYLYFLLVMNDEDEPPEPPHYEGGLIS